MLKNKKLHELKEEHEFLKSLKQSLDDVKAGRLYPHKFDED